MKSSLTENLLNFARKRRLLGPHFKRHEVYFHRLDLKLFSLNYYPRRRPSHG